MLQKLLTKGFMTNTDRLLQAILKELVELNGKQPLLEDEVQVRATPETRKYACSCGESFDAPLGLARHKKKCKG